MTRMRALMLSAAVSVLALGMAAPAAAQTSQQTTPRATGDTKAGMERGSAKFMKDAAQSDMFEIEAAKIALEKSRNEQVRSFAQKMLNDHQKMSMEMKQAAGGQPMSAESQQLDRKYTRKLDELRKETGGSFDKKYMEMQVEGHREALKLHQDYARNGDNASLKQVANKAVPHVQEHLQQAQSLQRQTAEVPRERTPTERSPSGQTSGDRAPMQQVPQQQQQQQRMPPGQRN